MRILVVDDHPEVLTQIEHLLSQEEDFNVCKSATIANAIAHLEECKPEIILIDPFVNGELQLGSLQEINEEIPTATIVVLAAIVDTSNQMELSKVGIKFILEKRIATEQLIDTIRLVEAIKKEEAKL